MFSCPYFYELSGRNLRVISENYFSILVHLFLRWCCSSASIFLFSLSNTRNRAQHETNFHTARDSKKKMDEKQKISSQTSDRCALLQFLSKFTRIIVILIRKKQSYPEWSFEHSVLHYRIQTNYLENNYLSFGDFSSPMLCCAFSMVLFIFYLVKKSCAECTAKWKNTKEFRVNGILCTSFGVIS